MKRLLFLGLCALALTSCASTKYVDAVPDNPLIKEITSTEPIEVDLAYELQDASVDDGTACIFKKITANNNGMIKTGGLFESWKVYQNEAIEYRDILRITENQVIDISTSFGLAEVGKRIAFALQYPKSMPHGTGQTIFAFIKNGDSPDMVIVAENYLYPSTGLSYYHFSLREVDHNCANTGSMVINHPIKNS